MSDYVLDSDPFIPTGVPATADQVAAMLADPMHPVVASTLALLTPDQRPNRRQRDKAVTLRARRDEAAQLEAVAVAAPVETVAVEAPVDVALTED